MEIKNLALEDGHPSTIAAMTTSYSRKFWWIEPSTNFEQNRVEVCGENTLPPGDYEEFWMWAASDDESKSIHGVHVGNGRWTILEFLEKREKVAGQPEWLSVRKDIGRFGIRLPDLPNFRLVVVRDQNVEIPFLSLWDN
jgi:hypothetical protein